ncbi:transmembrane protein 205-like [Babylonia areolata]|uniref:transmembrane protein 205-like n=1 Tax=Babylonia areolata TaxID=304850 RepID=UPI003FD2076F
MGKFTHLGVSHFQYFGVVVIMLFTSYLLYPGRRRMDSSSTAVAMLHLGAFTANLGAQLWVTLVAGLTMFYNLPRHMFGQVQSRLFPMFFLWSLVTSAVALATFITLHPFESWENSHLVQALCMLINFLAGSINCLIIAPIIVKNMVAAFDIEVAAGLRDVIGYANFHEMKKSNPDYAACYRKFRRGHGASVSLTMLSIFANFVLLYYVASHCVPV